MPSDSLPILCDAITIRATLAQETAITDLINTVLAAADEHDEDEIASVRDHLAAVSLANELAAIHDTKAAADDMPWNAAVQLKVWHLLALDAWLTAMTAER